MTVSLASCTDFLRGKPKNPTVIDYKNTQLNCLKDLSAQLDKFVDSQATEEDIDLAFGCLDRTLEEFQTKADGSKRLSYFEAEDVQNVFADFMPDAQISLKASAGLIQIKSALIGGDKDKLLKAEVAELRNYIKLIKKEVYNLHPFASIFSFKSEKRRLPKKSIDQGFKQFSKSLKYLLKKSELFKSDYSFEDFQNLVQDLGFISSEQIEMVSVLGEIKKLFAGQEFIDTETDYNEMIDSLVEIFKLYSLNQQNYVSLSLKDSDTLYNTLDAAFDLIDLLESSIQFKHAHTISAESIDSLLSVIIKKDLIKGGSDFKEESLQKLYKVIFVKVFGAGKSANWKDFKGLTKLHFSNLRRELAIYQVYAYFLKSLPWIPMGKDGITTEGRLNLEQIQTALKLFNPSSASQIYQRFDDATRLQISEAFNEMRAEFFSERPVVYQNGKMLIAMDQNKWTQSWEDLANALFNKVLARELILGWGQGYSIQKTAQYAYLTSDDLVSWYADFKDVGIQLKLFDPRLENSGAKSFKEANFFTYAGNGDDKLSFIEVIQYLNMLTSSGGKGSTDLQQGISQAGCDIHPDEKDVFGYAWKDEACAIKDLRANFGKYFSHLPYMAGFVSGIGEKQFTVFFDELMVVARTSEVNKGDRIEHSDLRTISMLLSYIEALFSVADTNKNRVVDHNEIRAIYPRFKSFATDYAYKNSKDKLDAFRKWNQCSSFKEEDLIRESFIFLVYHGRTPELNDINYISCIFGSDLITFRGEVNRYQIISTFKILKSVLESN